MAETVANLNAITLPATAGQFEIVLPGDIQTQSLPDVAEGLFTLNLAKATDITLRGDDDMLLHDDEEMMRAGDSNLDFDLPEGEIDLMGYVVSLSPRCRSSPGGFATPSP